MVFYSAMNENISALILCVTMLGILLTTRITLPQIKSLGLYSYLALMGCVTLSTLLLSPYVFNLYFIARDLFYFLSPIVLLLLGYSLARREPNIMKLLWAALIASTILSLLDFKDFFLSGGFLSVSMNARYFYGLTGDFAMLSVIILVCAKTSEVTLGSPRAMRILLALNGYMLLISFSRTNIAIVVVIIAALMIRRKFLRIAIIGMVATFILLPIISGAFSAQTLTTGDQVSFLSKFQRSFGEIAVREYTIESERNEFWRGYEAYLGIEAVQRQGGLAPLFGLGYGSYVEGPFESKLNIIPIFHNGFITFYLKGGALGLGLFLLFLYKLTARFPVPAASLHKDEVRDRVFLHRLSLVMVLSIAGDTLVTHGILYPWGLMQLLILGLIHGQRYRIRENDRSVDQALFLEPARGLS